MFTYDSDENLKLKMLSYNDYEELFILTDSSRNYLMEWLNFNTKAENSLNFIKNSLKGLASKNSLDTAELATYFCTEKCCQFKNLFFT